MKTKTSSLRKQAMAVITLLLLFCACYEFDFVDQPGSADPNSTFSVNISITTNDGDGYEYYPYFGVKLPVGWTVQDSIPFTYTSGSGIFVHSPTLSLEMESYDPADPGYYWWVSTGAEMVVYNYEETYLFAPVILTDDQTGNFYLDYMAGSNSGGYGGMNNSRSNDHLVTVGLADELIVTSNDDSGPGTLREAIENIDFSGSITFDLGTENTIILNQELVIYKDISITGEEDDPVTLSGKNTSRIFFISQGANPQLSHLALIQGNAFNGNGGGIFCDYGSAPLLDHLFISHCKANYGGGIYLNSSNAVLNAVTISNNDATGSGGGMFMNGASVPELDGVSIVQNTAGNGGGIYCSYNANPLLKNVSIRQNTADQNGGGLYCDYASPVFDWDDRCNIYLNEAITGTDLVSWDSLMVVVDTFTVSLPNGYFAHPIENFQFDIQHGIIEQTDADLYVSPTGDNTNSGLSPDQPLKTIRYGMLKILAKEDNPHTLHLLEGTYSASENGESFPVIVRNHVNIEGVSQSGVILDAESQSRVLGFTDIDNCTVKQFTVTGGMDDVGAGILMINSTPVLENLRIINNIANMQGGGLYLQNGSNPTLSMVTINNNTAYQQGGGVYFMNTTTITFDEQNRSNISMNLAGSGHDLYNSSYNTIDCVVDTFTVIIPNAYHAYPLNGFQFDILHGRVELVTADLYVSPEGNNCNSGLSEDDPLRNINFAYSKLIPDTNAVNIYLQPGVYSPSNNGEAFPLQVLDFTNLVGSEAGEVILDAEQTNRVVKLYDIQESTLSNLSITGGYIPYDQGGGLLIQYSDPVLEHLKVFNNASQEGGGIYCYYADPLMTDVDIYNNTVNGDGGGFYASLSNPLFDAVRLFDNTAYSGGGMYIYNSSPDLSNTEINNNHASYRGGAVYCGSYASPAFKNASIHHNTGQYGGGIYFRSNSNPAFDTQNRCSIYLNEADQGSDLYSDKILEVVVDTFTVLYPKFYHASPLSNFTFDILHGLIPQVEADLYVSPEGDDDNTGLTPDDPLKTIRHALIKIVEDSVNLYTIHLLDGVYSPSSNGEEFPLMMAEYVHLSGSSPEAVILDAEQSGIVLRIEHTVGSKISDLTVTGGMNYSGGGIYCYNADPVLENLVIANNHSPGQGGGMYFEYNANPFLKDVVFSGNQAQSSGGGIYAGYSSTAVLENTTFVSNHAGSGGAIYANETTLDLKDVYLFENQATYSGGGLALYEGVCYLENTSFISNSAETGGGIYSGYNSTVLFDSLQRSDIYFNFASIGKEIYSGGMMTVILDTFTVMYPSEFFVYPLENFVFDILHYKFEQVDADLYVSPEGSDENQGLSADDPLKTIYAAFSKIMSDSVHQNTVHLLDGTYGPSFNGDNFPISMLDYVSIDGTSKHQVVLYGEDQHQILLFQDNQGSVVSNMTLSHGKGSNGGAIHCSNSDPILFNLILTSNTASSYGGGMYCYESDPVISNISFTKNHAYRGAGLYIGSNSTPLINDVSFKQNQVTNSGGALYVGSGSHPELTGASLMDNTAQGYGGGVFIDYNSNASFANANITMNKASRGAGIYCVENAATNLINTDIHHNTAETYGGGVCCEENAAIVFDSADRCNIYLNKAITGKDIYSSHEMLVVVDTFTVLYPTKLYAAPLANFEFEILHGLVQQINADLFVSPEGDNNNNGLTADDPLKTLYFAQSIIRADSLNPHTIHLMPGTYSDSVNGETFPASMLDYITLSGSGTDEVILDGMGGHGVLEITEAMGVIVENLSITGGYAQYGGAIRIERASPVLSNLMIQDNHAQSDGGGLYLNQASPAIENTIITNNNSYSYGGGMYASNNSDPQLLNVEFSGNQASGNGGGMLIGYQSDAQLSDVTFSSNEASNGGGMYIDNANPMLTGVRIEDNTANNYGGGMYCYHSYPELTSAVIRNNTAYQGGGMYSRYSSPVLSQVSISHNVAYQTGGGMYLRNNEQPVFDSLNRSSIYLNYAGQGSDIYTQYPLEVVVDTFTVMYPKNHQATPLTYFTFDILHGMLPQEQLQLYVSPAGADTNSGLTPADPLKTIQHAFSTIQQDTVNFYDVHLSEGTYSPATNGESFPLQLNDYVTLSGTSSGEVVLDAASTASVLEVNQKRQVEISDLTISGGSAYSGGGIYLSESNPLLENLLITGNTATNGAGLYMSQSSPVVNFLTVEGNTASSWGGGLYISNSSSPVLDELAITNNTAYTGGGLSVSSSSPSISQTLIKGNSATGNGGGIYTSSSTINMASTSIHENSATNSGGGIFNDYNTTVVYDSINRCNIYLNEAQSAYDLYTQNMMHVIVDTFTVLYPKGQHAYPLSSFTFDINYGMIPQVHADLWVSPEGDNGNSGTTPDEPLKTINYALSIVAEDSVNIYTVNLMEGIYSPGTNGEEFPIVMVHHIKLSGTGSDEVILDAEGSSHVLECDHILNAELSNLTITGGQNNSNGGGLRCIKSSPLIEDVVITGNTANSGGGMFFDNYSYPQMNHVKVLGNSADQGGGIYCGSHSGPVLFDVTIQDNQAEEGAGIFCVGASYPTMKNVVITGNNATDAGGGMHCSSSQPYLENVRIAHNTSSGQGGGIWCNLNATVLFDTVNRSNIYFNYASAGNDLYSDNFMTVVVDTFTVLYPKTFHAYPIYNFDFDILHGLINQVSADLYVSPEGDNANSGLSPEEPLKTIHFATSVIAEDSLNIYTIHLANGIYSPSTNGEHFPLFIPEYVGLEGEDMMATILDAEQSAQVMAFSYSHNVVVSKMTIQGGYNANGYGGGIFMKHSSAHFSEITVSGNYARYGGGIFLEHSNPVLSDMTVIDNSSYYGGAGLCFYDQSSPSMNTVTIWNNTAGTYGGGIYCSGSSSPAMTGISIKYNNASTGAGLYCSNNSSPVMDNVQVMNNVAEHSGGGIYAPYSNLSLKNGVVSNNTSTSRGGGIYLSNFTNRIENTLIANNTGEDGAGLYFSASAPILVDVVVTGNVASRYGGGIYLSISELVIENGTIGSNTAESGSGIFCYRSVSEVVNTILWNTPGDEVFFKSTGSPSSISIIHSLVQDGEDGIVTNENGTVEWLQGNITFDPLFIGTGDHPYALGENSPCIDMGSPDTSGLHLPLADILGNYRIWDGDLDGDTLVDMGAYEYGSVQLITGLENQPAHVSAGLQVSLYPNPVQDVVVVQICSTEPQEVVVLLHDLAGTRVRLLAEDLVVTRQLKHAVSLEGLKPGIYVLEVRSAKERITQKIVKIP